MPATLANFRAGIKLIQILHQHRYLIENKELSCYPKTVSEKLKSLEELVSIAAQARQTGKTVVFTNGCFDILHRGHVHVLRKAKAAGDILIVALNSDQSVRTIKGPARPVLAETDRVELISAMEMVDYVVLFDEADPYKLIAAIKPTVLAKGGDWSATEMIGADLVEKWGGKVTVIPYLKGFSTSDIIERIRSSYGTSL